VKSGGCEKGKRGELRQLRKESSSCHDYLLG
jgi:hypothetical protein